MDLTLRRSGSERGVKEDVKSARLTFSIGILLVEDCISVQGVTKHKATNTQWTRW